LADQGESADGLRNPLDDLGDAEAAMQHSALGDNLAVSVYETNTMLFRCPINAYKKRNRFSQHIPVRSGNWKCLNSSWFAMPRVKGSRQ
jgi:hypothetical protein